MKRFFCLLIAALLMFGSSAVASSVDFTTMTTEEILALIDTARIELTQRDIQSQEKAVIFDQDGVTVALSGKNNVEQSYDGSYKLTMGFVVTNASDQNIIFEIDDMYVNGWLTTPFEMTTVSAGKKAKDQIEKYHIDEDCDITSLEEIETIEFHMSLFNADSYANIAQDIIITINFK